jgi:chemotaxis protein methyltransferase CheR
VTEEEFRRLCEFFYRRTGMIFGEAKRYYVERRIEDRMSTTGCATFPDYFMLLRADLTGEVEQFINAMTVNETYFLREDEQLECLSSQLLDMRLQVKPKSEPIRIWSVPCSTGEEPYSIAIWLLEHWPRVDAHEIEIVGSDINTEVLDAAREGYFGERALMRLSPALIGKYFESMGKERWRIIEDLRQSVRFTPTNLMDSAATGSQGQFDVIFCRNVLIYFDDAARRTAAENLYATLAPGGFICLGHSESMSRISPLFEAVRCNNSIVYQRPRGGQNA